MSDEVQPQTVVEAEIKTEGLKTAVSFGKYTSMSILKKMHSIMSDTQVVAKDKKHDMGFTYLSESAVKQLIQPLLKKHKVLFMANPVDTRQVQSKKITKSGESNVIVVETWMEYRFIDIDSGEYIEGMFKGEGDNVTGKGLYASITGAIKYILTTHFLIPTGDDPESVKTANDKAEKKVKSTFEILMDAVVKVTPKEVDFLAGKIKEASVTKRITDEEFDNLCDAIVNKNNIEAKQEVVAKEKVEDNQVTEVVAEKSKPMTLAQAQA